MSGLRKFKIQFIAFFACALVLGDGLSLFGTPLDKSPEFLRRVWQTEDGLPDPIIRGVLQSRDGYLWLATEESLARFDGARFVEFDRKNFQQKADRWMVALAEGKDGSIWSSGCNGGLVRVKDGAVTHYSTNNGLPSDYVLSACVDKKGTVWIGTAKGLAQFRGDNRFTALTNEPGLIVEAVRALMEDHEGSLWIGTAGGLSKLQNGKFSSFTKTNLLEVEPIMSLYEGKDYSLWVGTSDGLSHLKDGKLKHYTVADGLAHSVVRDMREDAAGNFWVSSHGGLQFFADEKFLPIKIKDALTFEPSDSISDVLIYSLTFDHEGSLWAASSAGLMRLTPQKFKTLTKDDGLGYNQATCVFEDHNGAVWIGTFGGGLTRIKDGDLVRFTVDDGLSSNHILAIAEDHEGTMWIGTDAGGITRFKDGQFMKMRVGNTAAANTVRVIFEDRQGRVWVGSNTGVHRYENGKYVSTPLVVSGTKAIVQDQNGTIWIGTKGSGLIEMTDDKQNTYTTKNGLSSDLINTLYIDRDGALWIGTEVGGLNRFKNGKFKHFSTPDGAFNERVIQILEDDRGNFWMGTRNGIYTANKKELNDCADGRLTSAKFTYYGRADGLRRTQCNGIAQPAGWKCRDGRMWFPTLFGVVLFHPDDVTGNHMKPPVLIEEVLADGKPCDWRNGKFPPGVGQLEFLYTGLSFYVPEKVRFKYKLDGFDQDWQDAGTRRSARYTNLRPGNYLFRVKACNNDGIWNETGAEFPFVVTPHLYETKWFYVLCGLIAISLGGGVWWLRGLRLKKREQELMVLVSARTKELQQEVLDRKEAERRSQTFSRLGERLSLSASHEEAAEVIADAAEDLLGWDACSVYSYNAEEDQGHPIVIFNLVNGRRVNVLSAYSDVDLSNIVRKAIDKGAQLILRDQSGGTSIISQVKDEPARPTSLMFVPIRKGNKAVGVLSVQSNKTKAYTQNDLNTLQALADYCGGAFERIRAEGALRESRQVILRQERLAAVGQLSAGVAHEFNNILTIIKGHANLLMDNSHLPPETRQSIAQIAHSADRAANLTRQMLAFSRKQIMQPKVIDLSDTANQVTKMLSRLLGENISLRCDFAPQLPPINADAGMMEQIIMNLALNARDAMPKGGLLMINTSMVEISEQQLSRHAEAYSGKFVCLTVADTGIGMDEATQQRLFEPFFTTKEVGKGTGLGLSTVYGIVKQHHGWIEVASKKGQGTAFTICIPASTAAPHSSQKLPQLPVNGGSETILFVEDEPDIRSLARQILERYGYRVLEAGCGIEALKVWDQHKDSVDLLLTDMVMPEGMSGKDLARQLQAQKSDLKVIFTSGYSVETLEKDFMTGQEMGDFLFLPKPYQPQKLAQIIREALDSKN